MKRCILTLVVTALLAPAACADEGMWLFNAPPRKLLKEKYGFDPTPQWLHHVQRSSVRFDNGGSGSFVSADGLVMTNHHVGADCLQKLSDEQHNYLKEGFYARTHAEERRCPDLTLSMLLDIKDVTDQVNAVIKPEMNPQQAFSARRAVISRIEKEASNSKTHLFANVITLYQGAKYNLYVYRKYLDVRLVFAPEQQTAFFGGDPDNFEYPRYDLDICFFRVYENDTPAHIKDYLRWSKNGAQKDELIFVSGNPGRTDRLDTMARLRYLRDDGVPYLLERLYRLEVLLTSWGARSEENARRARELLFGVQNSRKARYGGLLGLMNPAIMAKKLAEEARLRHAAETMPALKGTAAAWPRIAGAQKVMFSHLRRFTMLETAAGFNSTLFRMARILVRAAEEKAKPNGQRLREFVESNLPLVEIQLFSKEPIYTDFEELKLSDSLMYLEEQLGHSDPLVRKVMADKSPQERATELVRGTRLGDVAVRRQLYEGGLKAIEESQDPMIQLARLVDPESRKLRDIIETQQEIERQGYAQIAKVKFALEGTSTYPDATFTLRLSFGTIKGYEQLGQHVPFETHFAGLYKRAEGHHNLPPFDLPRRWVENKDKLDMSTPFNFVCTADIIGGNSGSPVINKDAEVVGLIFDGNIQSLVLDYIYTEKEARAVAVHSQAIPEALRKIYDANDLADELTGQRHAQRAARAGR